MSDQLPAIPDGGDKEPEVTEAEIEAAVVALAVTGNPIRLSAQGLKHKSVLGRYMRQLGIVEVGRGELAVANERVGAIFHELDGELQKTTDPQVRASLLKLKVELNRQGIEVAREYIKGTPAGPDGQVHNDKPQLVFPVGQQVKVAIVSSPEKK